MVVFKKMRYGVGWGVGQRFYWVIFCLDDMYVVDEVIFDCFTFLVFFLGFGIQE